MAPIQFFTYAIVLSAAVAAPINSNHVGAGKAGVSAPSKHQSEPMRVADRIMSGVPMMSVDTQAMKSSAAVMAFQTPPAMTSGRQSDGVFGILNKLPIKREDGNVERRQMKEITDLLASINTIAKRNEELEERQLGLIKSVPEALGQVGQLEKLAAGLPIKRDGSGILGGLGGLGDELGGSVKRTVEAAGKHEETYTDKALKGFEGWMHHGTKDEQETPEMPEIRSTAGLGDIAKRADPIGTLLNGILAKRETEGAEDVSHETYTDKALKGFQGWIHHGTKQHKEESPEVPSAADSLGLADAVKRSGPLDELTGLLGNIAKREHMSSDDAMSEALAKRNTEEAETHETYTDKALKGFQGWIHHGTKQHKEETPEIPSAADSLGLADAVRRSGPLDELTGLLGNIAKREHMSSDDAMPDALAKRNTEEAETHETYTDKALKGFQGWIHHGTKQHKEETPEIPSAADSLGLADAVKRSGPLDEVTNALGLSGLAKRDMDDTSVTASDALTSLAKRNGLDSIDELIKGLTKGGQLNNGLNIRQLNVLSALATGALSNAGTAAGQLGKLAAGKHRRDNGNADATIAAAMAGMNVGSHHKAGSIDDESADLEDIAADVAEGDQTLQDATSSQGRAGEHLDKRQVPPIAGSDGLSIIKGLLAHPNAALDPVTKGILVGGTPLGDMAPH